MPEPIKEGPKSSLKRMDDHLSLLSFLYGEIRCCCLFFPVGVVWFEYLVFLDHLTVC